jgi:hypothetical protein
MRFPIGITLALFLCLAGAGPSFAKDSCAHRFAGLLRSVPGRAVNYLKTYGREVRDSRGLRILIRERASFTPSDGAVTRINSFLMNPIATAFDRPRQATIPLSLLGWTALVELPIAALEEKQDAYFIAEAERRLRDLPPPGSALVLDLERSHLITKNDAAQLILHAWPDLRSWIANPKEKTARLEELVKMGVLSGEQAAAVDGLMRKIFTLHLQHDSKDGWAGLENDFTAALGRLPELKNIDEGDRSLVATAFFPLVKLKPREAPLVEETIGLKTLSDLELMRTLNRSSASDANTALARTVQLLDKNLVSYPDALAMTLEATTGAKELREKLVKAEAMGISELGERPDIPSLSAPTPFSGAELKDELDRWQLLQTDPRFEALRQARKDGKIGEVAALAALQAQINGRQSFLLVDRALKGKRIDAAGARLLFGIPSSTMLNPLLIEAREALAANAKQKGFAPAQISHCMVEIANFWRDYYVQEEALKQSSKDFLHDLHGFIEQHRAPYETVQTSCADSS